MSDGIHDFLDKNGKLISLTSFFFSLSIVLASVYIVKELTQYAKEERKANRELSTQNAFSIQSINNKLHSCEMRVDRLERMRVPNDDVIGGE